MGDEAGDDRAEEKPPKIEDAREAIEAKRLENGAVVSEELGSFSNGEGGVQRDGSEGAAFEDADANGTESSEWSGVERYGSGERVAGIGTSHNCEKSLKIGDSASHGADDADPGKCAAPGREMAS